MLKIDRSAVDAAIEKMEMFTATKEVLAEYEAERNLLEKRGEGLNKKIAELKEEHASTMIDRETVAKDSISDYIYLSGKMKQINDEMTTVLSLQDQLKEDIKQLKQKHLPIIKRTYETDLSAKNAFDVNHAVELIRFELLSCIADFAKEVKKKQQPLMTIIGEFLDDEELMMENRSFMRTFEFDSTHLSYWAETGNSVISKNQVFSACGGSLDPNVRPPAKDVE